MLTTQTVDLSELPARDRFDYWSDLIARDALPQRFESEHAADFNAWLRVTSLGSIRVSSFKYPSLYTQRTPRQIRRSDPELYQLSLPTTGRSVIAQGRRESALQPADFALVDSSRPHEASHSANSPTEAGGRAASITVLVPYSLIPLPRAKIGQLFAARLRSGEGLGALLAHYLLQIAKHPEQYQESDSVFLGNTALDLIVAMLAQQLDATTSLPLEAQHRALRTRIKAFIDEHLSDPRLSPKLVADAHNVSVRTLHRLFQDEPSTVAELIRTLRLNRCKRDLVLLERSVSGIAGQWGFPSKAHFSRLFRSQFGVSPQAYREQARHPRVADDRPGHRDPWVKRHGDDTSVDVDLLDDQPGELRFLVDGQARE
ncbi:AraC-like ligand-binding domain-containing protein [Dactylosporangium darangshiense]|uniref:AraC-like ligand-binding domain-containing protein n=1 Tax=Dactylosporangium darangshiense TaxID=579108 RepID=UPI0031EFF873